MAYGTMKLGIKGLEEVNKQLKNIEKSTEKVIKNTASDMRKRAPGRVADVIRQTYNIKKGDILQSNKVEEGKASVKLKGSFGKNFRIVYQGDRLSPTHFGMTPKVPPVGRSYTLRTQSLKGKRVTLDDIKPRRKPADHLTGSLTISSYRLGAGKLPAHMHRQERPLSI